MRMRSSIFGVTEWLLWQLKSNLTTWELEHAYELEYLWRAREPSIPSADLE